VCVLYGILAALFCAPLFSHPLALGRFDWDQHLFYYAEVLKNVLEYAQPPFWSPWYCGGNVMWQNPQVALLSPVYPLATVMPLALAMKINIVLHYWIAFIGMHLLLTRVIGVRFLPAVVLLASMFTLSGAMAMHLAVGHPVFLPAFYVPLLMFFFFRAIETGAVRPALYAAALVALTMFSGGLHIVPMELVAIGVFAVCAAVARRSWRPLVLAAVIGAAGAAYAAPKLAPAIEFVTSDRFWDAREPIAHPDRMSPLMMWRAYTDASQDIGSTVDKVQRHGWWEYGNYVGTFTIVLIALSIVWSWIMPPSPGRWLARALGITSVVFLVLSAGEFYPFAPAVALRHVPWLSFFRIPSRFTIGFVLFGALTAGAAARSALDRLVRPRQPALSLPKGKLVVATMCAIALLQIALVNRTHFRETFLDAPLDGGFRVFHGSQTLARDADGGPSAANSSMLRAAMRGQPLFSCSEGLQLARNADVHDPLVWAEGHAKISSVAFSPNRVQFSAVGGPEPSRVFLNQNSAPGWRGTAGPVLLDRQSGRMFVELAPFQTGRFAFSFVPPGLMMGSVLFLVAIAATALVWNARLAAIPFEWNAIAERERAAVSFVDRAERATKVAVTISFVLLLAARVAFADFGGTKLAVLMSTAFAISYVVSRRSTQVVPALVAMTFVAPVVAAKLVPDAPAFPPVWYTALFAAMLPRLSLTRWNLPPAWRVPLAGWALAGAIGWPILAAREMDFHPELSGVLDMPASLTSVSARTSIVLIAEATIAMMLGILWLDWLFGMFPAPSTSSGQADKRRFRQAIVLPLLASCAVACAVAAYQLFVDINFLNNGWASFGRASGTAIDANGFGIIAVLGGCAFLALVERGRTAWNTAMIAGFVLTVIGAWASGSRTTLVALVIAVAFAGQAFLRDAFSSTMAARRRHPRLLAAAIAVVVSAAILYALRQSGPVLRVGWILPSASVESVAAFAKEMLWNRNGYGRAAIEMILKSPWAGVGVGSFQTIVADYPYSHLGGPLQADNAQNWIRHNLAELGVVGSLGWMIWAAVLGVAIVARARRPRDRAMTIIGGALVAVLVVSQVGIPTQNLGVAMTFWTFVFWYFAYPRSSSSEDEHDGRPRSVPRWQWVALVIGVATFAAGTLQTSVMTLRVPNRARDAGWHYDYNFYWPDITSTDEEFRWTRQNAVAVLPALSRRVKLSVWVTRPDVKSNPVLARVWHDNRLVIDSVLTDDTPVTTYLRIDRDPQWLMLRTYLDRELAPEPRHVGLAVQWTFLDLK
jgi:hypothetical protein